MTWIALKMLTGNRAKYYAIIFGISFAVMLMTQQLAIFAGLMRNMTSQIRDIQGADIWVMDPSVQFIDDITPLSDNAVLQVRGVSGVAWAVKLYNGKGWRSSRKVILSSSSFWVLTTKPSSVRRQRWFSAI